MVLKIQRVLVFLGNASEFKSVLAVKPASKANRGFVKWICGTSEEVPHAAQSMYFIALFHMALGNFQLCAKVWYPARITRMRSHLHESGGEAGRVR